MGSQTYSLVVGEQGINSPPVITSTPLFIAAVGNPYSYQIAATDSDGDSLSYQLIKAPVGMSIDAATGLVI